MNEALAIWLPFVACLLVIGIAGPELSRTGDIIAEKTHLSRSWIGVVLLATVTSLPELFTGLSAVTVVNAPDIAVGDVLGSCLFNLAILAFLDLASPRESIYARAGQGHVLSAAFGVLLIGFAGFNLTTHDGFDFSAGHIGLYTPVSIVLYAVAMRSVFFYEKRNVAEFTEDVVKRYPGITLRQAVMRGGAAALAIVAAGTWLPFIGADIAESMGWERSFVGTLFVAGATSAPELVVTFAAFRLGALDMAVANILGSNLFDMLILSVDDIFFLPGPLLAAVSPDHAITAFAVIAMNALVIVGFVYRPKKSPFWRGDWVSLGVLSIYVATSYLLYARGT